MRNDILRKKDQIAQWIKEGQYKVFMCRELQCQEHTLNRCLEKLGFDYKGNQCHKGKRIPGTRKSALEYSKGISCKSYILKEKLIEEGIKKRQCEKCKRTKWLGRAIPLELHHKDGNHYNNEFSNLVITCPTCHAIDEQDARELTKSKKHRN